MLKIITRHKKGCGKRRGCACPLHLHGTINGRRIRESLDTSNTAVARRRQAHRELELLTGDKRKPITVADAVAAHMKDIERRGFVASTVKKYKRLGANLTQLFGRRHVDDIEPEDLRQFIATWKLGPRTQQKQIERLKAFFNFCADSGWIDRSPAKPLKGPKVPPTQIKPYTTQDLKDMLGACEQFGFQEWERARMKALIVLMWLTGLNIGDAVRLPKSAMKGNKLTTRRKKTGEPVHITVPGAVVRILDAFKHASSEYYFWTGAGDPDGVARTYQRRFRRIFDLAGIPDGTTRRFRQTVASKLAAVGIEHAQHALGHSSVRTTEKHYAGWTPERQQGLTAAAARAFGDDMEALAGAFGTPLTHGAKPRAN